MAMVLPLWASSRPIQRSQFADQYITPLVSACPVCASAMAGAKTKAAMSVVRTEGLISIILVAACWRWSIYNLKSGRMQGGDWSSILVGSVSVENLPRAPSPVAFRST
jgi:hypothetical protein